MQFYQYGLQLYWCDFIDMVLLHYTTFMIYWYGLPYWNFKSVIFQPHLSAPIYDMFSLLRYFIQTLLCCIICCSCVAAADLKLNWLRNLVDLYQFQNSKDIFQQVQCFPKEVLHQVFTLICQLMQLPSLVSCCAMHL